MDHCSTCRRTLNGALVCPGCGAYAPDIDPWRAVAEARAAEREATQGDSAENTGDAGAADSAEHKEPEKAEKPRSPRSLRDRNRGTGYVGPERTAATGRTLRGTPNRRARRPTRTMARAAGRRRTPGRRRTWPTRAVGPAARAQAGRRRDRPRRPRRRPDAGARCPPAPTGTRRPAPPRTPARPRRAPSPRRPGRRRTPRPPRRPGADGRCPYAPEADGRDGYGSTLPGDRNWLPRHSASGAIVDDQHRAPRHRLALGRVRADVHRAVGLADIDTEAPGVHPGTLLRLTPRAGRPGSTDRPQPPAPARRAVAC